MAWYWPKIHDESSAEDAVKPAVGVSGFVAVVSGIIAILSIYYGKPILGFTGWSLVDALLFVLIAWRIARMSRAWAVVGLVMYLLEVIYNLGTGKPGSLGVLTIVFILTYVGALRGTFSYHRFRRIRVSLESPPSVTTSQFPEQPTSQ